MGYGYIIGVCVVLFVLITGGFGVLMWLVVNRKEVERSLLTHPRDRKPRNAASRARADDDDPDDLQTDAQT